MSLKKIPQFQTLYLNSNIHNPYESTVKTVLRFRLNLYVLIDI